ncbi:MAG: DUF3137 domain-containing protein [Alphaproteobacteria bacterium]
MQVDEAAIARAIETGIRPALAHIEATRRGSLMLAKIVAAVIFGFFGVVALILGGLISVWLAVAALAVGALLAGVTALLMVRLYRGVARSVMVPPLAEAIGGMTYAQSAEGFNAEGVAGLGILPTAQRVTAEDMIVGTHRGTGFRMVELSCYIHARGGQARDPRRRQRLKRIWRGLVVEVDVPVQFEGPVLLARDRGTLARWAAGHPAAGRGLSKVSFPHAAFSQAFEVFAANPAEAERLITPELAESLVALSRARPGKALAAAFARGVFLLTIPLPRGFLDQGSLFQPADRLLDRVPAILRELTLPHRVIDYLMGDRPGDLL